MARAQFWNEMTLSTASLNEIWDAATSRSPFLNDPFTFRDIAYDDALVLSYEDAGTQYTFEFYGTDITLDANFNPLGTVTGLASWFREAGQQWFYSAYIDRFSVSATAFDAAMKTASQTDDQAIYRTILSGNDNVILSEFDDEFFGANGRDRIRGGLGNDTIAGDAGNDTLEGGNGRDVLNGGAGADILIGGRGADVLTGGTGGGKVDQFVFNSDSGRDRVTDFDDGLDRIVISNGAETFADLSISAVTAGVRVSFGTVQITLVGEQLASITASDFDFV